MTCASDLRRAQNLKGQGLHSDFAFYGDCASSRRFFSCAQDSFVPPCFCARHVAGGMPNWLMNHRVNELAIE
jgi:hypothetical protein